MRSDIRGSSSPWLPFAFLVCFGAAFLLRPAPVWALTFYLGVLPATLYRLWRGPPLDWRDGNMVLTALLILWLVLTLLLGDNPGGGRVPKFLWGAICTSIFFIGLVTMLRDSPQSARRIGTVFIWFGGINAAFSVVFFFFQPSSRLVGWAETRHSILGALIIGACCLFAFDRALHERSHRYAHGAMTVLFLLFIVLTGSRGPLFSIAAAMAVLLLDVSRRVILLVLAAAIGIAAAIVFEPHLWAAIAQPMIERASYRPEIWSFTLDRVAERPWLGHGMAAYLGMTADFTFPHNLYLSSLFYSGIVGLCLLLALIVSVTTGLVRSLDRPGRRLILALWVLVLCGGLTDLGQVTEGPGTLWLTLWLPLGMATAALAADRVRRDSVGKAQGSAVSEAPERLHA